ncbi:lipoprotein-releasing system permease protein [Thermovibrio guaymasensis]|uniref:Lipoprotein-releasing system permease protein n=1 Tax=Thermovibrio guaymasensis TaxID=240167 RepID=A0A420W9W7_9BACT|nr:ABC transporter permease [Thermovibrio guaymasensis]RKQ64109.1 lipoprotein-releasing system permease protein [Thermovibrio guaymasensis]
MFSPLLRWLAFRTVKAKGYSSFAFFIAVLGVVIGVAALIVVNSVMTGFQDAIKERLLSANADVIVLKRGSKPFYKYKYALRKIEEIPHVVGAEPFIYVPVMAVGSSSVASSSASIRGCYPELEPSVTSIPNRMVLGDWEIFKRAENGVVVGRILADTLGVTVGDTIKVISPLGKKTPFGVIPRTAKFIVVGIFEVGMYQFDSSLILAHVDDVRRAFGIGNSVTGIMVNVDKLENVPFVKERIEEVLGEEYSVQDWISLNKSLFSALKLEKLAMFLILTLIVLVASFNISSLLMVNVNSKAKDIAILKAMGALDSFILRVFILQGLFIGLIGTIVGEVIGISVSYLGEKYRLIPLPPDVYYIDHLPFKLHFVDCLTAAIAAILISVLATIYPSLRAARTQPVKVLRMGES